MYCFIFDLKEKVWSSINKQYECRHQYRMFICIYDVFNNWANRRRQAAGAVIRCFSFVAPAGRRYSSFSWTTVSKNDCLQLFDHYDHMRKPFWGGRRSASANYLSLCSQNVKDKTGETKHIQEKFFLILITTIYIHTYTSSFFFVYISYEFVSMIVMQVWGTRERKIIFLDHH